MSPGGVTRRVSGGEGSGGPQARPGRKKSVSSAATAALVVGWLPFGSGCLCFCPGRGAVLVSRQPQALADPQQTHVCSVTRSPAFSTVLSVRKGGTPCSSRAPSDPACWIQRPGNSFPGWVGKSVGGSTGTVTNAPTPGSGIPERSKPLGAALRNPAIVSASG